ANWLPIVLDDGRGVRLRLWSRISADEHGGSPSGCQILSDLITFTRNKIERMVRGLFPGKEQGPMENSLNTAWLAASVYLDGIGADLLNNDGSRSQVPRIF
ncbi:MAG: hypothetical protein GY725_08590, partial [bacterium]|nr:hypothetical protein [bacterium]